ncbi:hypothetical protein GCM10009104_00300 [Marinobacterium maritimum]|uniref:Alkylhydroperoxidase family enzyme, contains CxxC motif n=1 Tax=Marinobacterium maritimum TaxID=500162 RepID=A0ABP3TC24_9GAMM
MALLPKKLRFWLFDTLSLKTMRYVEAVPRHKATGLVAEVYDMIVEDFFINGSLTSRSRVPSLLAAIWSAGRETALVDDRLDRTTKEAMTATLSGINDCPYCGDMLVSLVHAGDRHEDAARILNERENQIDDPLLRERLLWVRAVATSGAEAPLSLPFTEDELPEAIGALMALSDINRFSHIVMDGSPVKAPLGLDTAKAAALWIFGGELRATHISPLEPGRSLHLLPDAELPADLHWAESNPRIARTLAQWTAAVERQAQGIVPEATQRLVHARLQSWQNEKMPISRQWVETETEGLEGEARDIARFALLIAKASYQIDDRIIEAVLGDERDQERFIRILAWSTFTAARYFANHVARLAAAPEQEKRVA